MKKLIPVLWIVFAFSIQKVNAQNAPITTVGTIVSYGSSAVIPITAINFNNIGSCNLKLTYDPAIATVASVTPGPLLGGSLASNLTVPGVITLGWYIFPGKTLPDNTVIFNISFLKVTNGTTALTWTDNGYSCIYYDGNWNPLNDQPTSVYYLNGSLTFRITTQWTGSINNNWSSSGNWTFGVPNQYIDAIIPFVNPNPYPFVEGDAMCYGLNIASGASLNIKSGSTLTAFGDFINNGQFTIESSSTGDGSFINNGTITGSGYTSVQRYLVSELWHFVSPPISNGVSGIFYDIYLRLFNEPAGTYNYIVPINLPLNPMQGYEAWASDYYTGTTTVFYVGSLNTGDLSISNLTHTPGSLYSGYNLVGNPYPSAVDWDYTGGWIKTNLDNATYRWNPYAGNYATYNNGIGINSGTNIIPSGQGFFVHVSNGYTTGSLSVNNSARLHNNTAFLKKTEASIFNACLRLKTFSETNSYSDETIIQYADNATPNYDPEFDAYKMSGLIEAPQLYSITTDHVNLTVNTNPQLTANIVIPVGFVVGINGIYTIEATTILNFSSATNIILEDIKENVMINLTDQASYTFFANLLDNPDRFNIHFLVIPASAETTTFTQEILIFSDGNEICLKRLGEGLLYGQLVIYDLLGKEISKKEIYTTNRYQEVFNNKGIFIVMFRDCADNKIYRTEIFLR